MAEVVDGLLGLPVTPGAVDVLEGRQCAPSDVGLTAPSPLESPAGSGRCNCRTKR